MEPDDQLVALLRSIDRRLALLTVSQERALRAALRDDLLRTPARIAMFDAIDGQSDSADLARAGGGGKRTAQLFTKELTELGIVRAVPGTTGKAVIVERDEAGILDWYLQREG